MVYVQPSPKMSCEATIKSEYYCQEFNCIFHPIIYKMINQLCQQTEYFQKYVDPIYDQFILDSIMINNPSCFENINSSDKTKNSKKYMKHRRFAPLSILTCGSNDLRGSANV